MRKIVIFSLNAFLLLLFLYIPITSQSLSLFDGIDILSLEDWKLTWHDEFENTKINKDYWTMQKGANIWGNNELEYYTDRPQNCFINNGKLIIRAQKEDYQNSRYTSARIITRNKVDFSYGKIEVKAKLPEGRGLWPAIWLMPSSDTYHDRKKNGEIDIMEMLGHETNTVYGTVFSYINGKYGSSYGKYQNKNIDFSDSFHIFSLEWSKDEIKWLVDNKVFHSFNLSKNFTGEYEPFSKKFYLILNLAVGGDWPGAPSFETHFPSLMEIDYVRYYTKGR